MKTQEERWDEIIDEMDGDGGIDHFSTSKAAVREVIRIAVAESEIAPKGWVRDDSVLDVESELAEGPDYTPEELTQQNVWLATQISKEIQDLMATHTQLRGALITEAGYEGRSAKHLVHEHPLGIQIEARLRELREQLVGLI